MTAFADVGLGDLGRALDDPRLWAVFAVILAALLLLRGATAPSRRLDAALRTLSESQHRLHGGLTHIAEAQGAAQARMVETMERRMAEIAGAVGDNLGASAQRTSRSLGDLQARLGAIDRAQGRIEKLSENVLGLQDILSNKQTRGAFGEIQLREIVERALPPDVVRFQAQLSNGTRADCLIDLPAPPGPIVIDAKFPLEPYEALIDARGEAEAKAAARAFRAAVRTHLRAIAEKYILDGETADGALMFLPSEAVYAELHARFADIVREGFDLRVWIVSPTTCMATLNTLRAVLKDTRLRAEAAAIRRELALLHRDVERLATRAGNLDRHFAQARRDVAEIVTAAERGRVRARRLEAVDFSGPDPAQDGMGRAAE